LFFFLFQTLQQKWRINGDMKQRVHPIRRENCRYCYSSVAEHGASTAR
jgi:hypothetical protein